MTRALGSPSLLLSLALFGLLLPACTAGGSGRPGRRDGGGLRPEESVEECSDFLDNDRDGLWDCDDPSCALSCGTRDAGPRRDGGFMGCAADNHAAEGAVAPVDIVWVIDTSGSMSNEAERVQNNMQAFAEAIGRVGIDWHVVVISTQDYVNVPASLATHPGYRLIDRPVSSNEPLRALMDELPNYIDFLRRSSVLHFIAVTDDESDVSADDFQRFMATNLGRSYLFHTISSEMGTPSFPSNPNGACTVPGGGFPPEGAAEPGLQYWELARRTGGQTLSICTPAEEWASLFDTLTRAIAIPIAIPCAFGIPEPPPGEELDTGRVNVVFYPSSGAAETIPYVAPTGAPDCSRGGWYYDNPAAPTQILLCSDTCDRVNADTGGRVEIALGCETVLF